MVLILRASNNALLHWVQHIFYANTHPKCKTDIIFLKTSLVYRVPPYYSNNQVRFFCPPLIHLEAFLFFKFHLYFGYLTKFSLFQRYKNTTTSNRLEGQGNNNFSIGSRSSRTCFLLPNITLWWSRADFPPITLFPYQ